jgi:hypothetical protein
MASKLQPLDGLSSNDCDVHDAEDLSQLKCHPFTLSFVSSRPLERAFQLWSFGRSNAAVASSLLLFGLVRVAEYFYHRFLSGFSPVVADWIGFSVILLAFWDVVVFASHLSSRRVTILWTAHLIGCAGMMAMSVASIRLDPTLQTATVAFNATLLIAATPSFLSLRFAHVAVVAAQCAIAIIATFIFRSFPVKNALLALAYFAAAAFASLLSARSRERAERHEFVALVALRRQFRQKMALAQRLVPPRVAARIVAGESDISSEFKRPIFVAFICLRGGGVPAIRISSSRFKSNPPPQALKTLRAHRRAAAAPRRLASSRRRLRAWSGSSRRGSLWRRLTRRRRSVDL